MAVTKFLASSAPAGSSQSKCVWAANQARQFYLDNPTGANLYVSDSSDQYVFTSRTVGGHTFPSFTAGLPIGTRQAVAVWDIDATFTAAQSMANWSHVRIELPAGRTYGHSRNDYIFDGGGAQYFSMVGTGTSAARNLGSYQDRPEWTVNKPVWDMRTGGTNAKWLATTSGERYWHGAYMYFLSVNDCTHDNNATSTFHQSTSLWTPYGNATNRPKNILFHDIDTDGQWAGYGWSQCSGQEECADINFRNAGGTPHRKEMDGGQPTRGDSSGIHRCIVLNSYSEGVNAAITMSPTPEATTSSDDCLYDLIYVHGATDLMRCNRSQSGLPGGGIQPGANKVNRAWMYGPTGTAGDPFNAPIQTANACRNHVSRGVFESGVPGMTAADMVNVRWNGTISGNKVGTQDAAITGANYLLNLWQTNYIPFNSGPPVGNAPSVATDAITSVTTTGGTVNYRVNPNGASTTTEVEYGLTASYGSTQAGPSAGSGTTERTLSQALTGLTAGTLYHYRVNATNTNGTTNGADQTFTTQSSGTNTEAPTVTITSPAASVLGVNQVLTATATDPDNIASIEYRTRFPDTAAWSAWRVLPATGGADNEGSAPITLAASTTNGIEVRATDRNSSPLTSTPVALTVTETSDPNPNPGGEFLPDTTGRIALYKHVHLYRDETAFFRPTSAQMTTLGQRCDMVSGQWHTGEAGHANALLPEPGLLRLNTLARGEATLVAANPDILLDLYYNGGAIEGETFGRNGGAPSGTGAFVPVFPATWYRVKSPTFFGNYYAFIDDVARDWTHPATDPYGDAWPATMGTSTRNWRKFVRKWSRKMMETHPAGTNPATGKPYYRSVYLDIMSLDPTRTATDLIGMMDDWKGTLGPLGYHLCVNSLQDGAGYFAGTSATTGAKQLLGHADMYNMEFFLKDPTAAGTTWPSVTRWEADVSAVIDAQLAGAEIRTGTKIYDNTITQPQSDQWRELLCATALIANRGKLWVEYNPFGMSSDPATSYPDTGVGWQNSWRWYTEVEDTYPIYGAKPGAANDAASTAADGATGTARARQYQVAGTPGLYKAGFTGGYAIVNLSGSTQSVTFTGTMNNAKTGASQSSPVSVPNNSGVILVAATAPVPSTAPTLTQVPNASTSNTTADFTWSAVPNATSYERNLDGAGYVTNGAARTYSATGLSVGTHTFQVRAVNAAGTGPASPIFTWQVVSGNVNEEQPTITYLGGSSVDTPTPTLLFQVDDPDGILSVEWRVNNGEWTNAFLKQGTTDIWVVQPTFRGEGTVTLEIRATDNF